MHLLHSNVHRWHKQTCIRVQILLKLWPVFKWSSNSMTEAFMNAKRVISDQFDHFYFACKKTSKQCKEKITVEKYK